MDRKRIDGWVHENAEERLAGGAKSMIFPTKHADGMLPVQIGRVEKCSCGSLGARAECSDCE